jgi:hypothetical protein
MRKNDNGAYREYKVKRQHNLCHPPRRHNGSDTGRGA